MGKRHLLNILTCLIYLYSSNVLANDKYTEFDNYLSTAKCYTEDKNLWLDKCYKLTMNSMMINDCIIAKYKSCDKLLNKEYAKVINRAKKVNYIGYFNEEKGSATKRLKASELSWIKFRDTDCENEIDYSGSSSTYDLMECKTDKTKERIKYLKNLYKNYK